MSVRSEVSRAAGPARLGALACGAVLLAGCASAAAQSSPTWVPQRSMSPIQLPAQIPGGDDDDGGGGGGAGGLPGPVTTAPGEPSQSPSVTPDPTGPSPSSSTPTSAAPQDPNVVATKLTAPAGLVVLPDGTALVAERTTGRIMAVQPTAGTPAKAVMTLTGLDTAGSGGVLAMALSATYGEDGLILALITTAKDLRVVHFTLGGPVTPILTGIPKARAGNTGALLVRPDGSILVGTGDADDPRLASNPASLAGKILRIDDIGGAAPGNPRAGSRVFTSGHDRVDGLCAGAAGGATYEVQADPGADEVNVVQAGAVYPAAQPAAQPKVTKGIADCAVSGSVLYVTGLGGKDLFSAPLVGAKIGAFTAVLHGRYGRLRTVVAATDGSLWLTTSNKDGQGTPVADDERVLHIRPAGGGGQSQV